MSLFQRLKSALFNTELNELSEFTHYSNVDEQEQYYLVAIKDNVWLKIGHLGVLSFTKKVKQAEVFKHESRAEDMAKHVDGKVIRVVVVHYYDEV